MRRSQDLAPAFAVVVAAAAWGIYWLPQREFENAGMTGGWATLGQYLVPFVLMTPIAVVRWRRGLKTGADMALIGLLNGGAIVCYANSFLLTDVVHALLLFYITPVWGTLLEIVVLRRPPEKVRWLALVVGLAGVWVVFASETGIPWPRNAGDWLALAGGMMLAAGVSRLNVVKTSGMFTRLYAYFLYGSIVAAISAWLLADHLGPTPSVDTLVGVLPMLVLFTVVFLIPANGILMWGATKISPGMFGILILSEIIVGMVSAALWSGETFGWREVIGGAMILTAGTLEIVLTPGRSIPKAQSPRPEVGPR